MCQSDKQNYCKSIILMTIGMVACDERQIKENKNSQIAQNNTICH